MCWIAHQVSVEKFSTLRCYELKAVGNDKTILTNSMHYEGSWLKVMGPATRNLIMDGFKDLSLSLKSYLEKDILF